MSDNEQGSDTGDIDYYQFFAEKFSWENASVAQLISVLLSELRVPLSSIKGYAELIVQAENSNQTLEHPRFNFQGENKSLTMRDCAQAIIRRVDHERAILDGIQDGFRKWYDKNNPQSE